MLPAIHRHTLCETISTQVYIHEYAQAKLEEGRNVPGRGRVVVGRAQPVESVSNRLSSLGRRRR
jgi:hypothetical protein